MLTGWFAKQQGIGDIEDVNGNACLVCPWHFYKVMDLKQRVPCSMQCFLAGAVAVLQHVMYCRSIRDAAMICNLLT